VPPHVLGRQMMPVITLESNGGAKEMARVVVDAVDTLYPSCDSLNTADSELPDLQ